MPPPKPVQCPWVASLPSSGTAPHSSVALANVLRVPSIPLPMAPTKTLNSASPNFMVTAAKAASKIF